LDRQIQGSLPNFFGNISSPSGLKLSRDAGCGLTNYADVLRPAEDGRRNSRGQARSDGDYRIFDLRAEVVAENFAPPEGRILMQQEKTETGMLAHKVLILETATYSPAIVQGLARSHLVPEFLLVVAASEGKRRPMALHIREIQPA
jgi:hypothetical protein